jgi:phage terminase large subunit-like protein
MVTTMLTSIDDSLPVSTVRAIRGKYLRAGPMALLYDQDALPNGPVSGA